MNFFAHYYYYNKPGDSWYNAGLLFPDLLRLFTFKQRISESRKIISETVEENSLITGINAHFKADFIFHNWSCFKEMSTALVLKIRNSPLVFKRDWFLSHIFIELAIDHILVSENEDMVRELYKDLELCKKNGWTIFFEKNKFEEADKWYAGLTKFNAHHYIFSYKDTTNVVYALNRIYEKTGLGNFTEEQSQFLVLLLNNFIPELKLQLKELQKILE